MTTREIIDYVQTIISSRRYWNDTKIINLINFCQNKMTSEMKLTIQDFYKFSSSLEQRYLLPSNLISIEELWYDNAGVQRKINIVPTPKSIYGVFDDPDTNTSDTPFSAFIWTSSGRRELWVYPLFSTEGIDVFMWFYGTPPLITKDNDMPSIPVEWHILLAEAVINKTQQLDDQISKSDELALWKDILNSCKTMDTTKNVMERGSIIRPASEYPISEVSFGMFDGSERGINWE